MHAEWTKWETPLPFSCTSAATTVGVTFPQNSHISHQIKKHSYQTNPQARVWSYSGGGGSCSGRTSKFILLKHLRVKLDFRAPTKKSKRSEFMVPNLMQDCLYAGLSNLLIIFSITCLVQHYTPIPRFQGDIFKCHFKTQRYLINDIKKAANLYIWEARTREYLTFLLDEWLERQIDDQNCQFSVKQQINEMTVSAQLDCVEASGQTRKERNY